MPGSEFKATGMSPNKIKKKLYIHLKVHHHVHALERIQSYRNESQQNTKNFVYLKVHAWQRIQGSRGGLVLRGGNAQSVDHFSLYARTRYQHGGR
jgi:hypothetical protein